MAIADKIKAKKYVPIDGILGEAEDYHIYRLSMRDLLIAVALGVVAGGVVGYVFFGEIIVILGFSVIGVAVAVPVMYNIKKKKRLNDMLLQFKDLLEALSASYSVGKNTMDAFIDAKTDMERIYGENVDIVRELEIIINGMANNIQIEVLMLNWAARSGLDDIESFANVFEIANRQGSDMRRVVNESQEIISQKITMEMELQTMLSGNKNELNIMICMPVLILLMANLLGMSNLSENNITNIAIKVGCLLLFAFSYLIGRLLINIKI